MDTDLAPERLGQVLREARRNVGLSRRRAAKRTGIEASRLRRYERGDAPVPDEVLARLRALYGDALDDLVAPRAPLTVEPTRVVAAGIEQPLAQDDRDALLSAYAHLVLRLRGVGAGEPLPLRADDLTVLAVALGSDPDDVAQHVAAVVGCTRAEAAALHDEVLRRRVLVPAAGLAIGAVAYASAVLAAPDTPAPLTRPPARAQLAVAVPDVSGAAAPRPTPDAAATAPSAPSAPAATATPAATAAPAPAAHVAPPPADDAGGRDGGLSNATTTTTTTTTTTSSCRCPTARPSSRSATRSSSRRPATNRSRPRTNRRPEGAPGSARYARPLVPRLLPDEAAHAGL
jgi:transcriptional regulator with XRE-family HTH domain